MFERNRINKYYCLKNNEDIDLYGYWDEEVVNYYTADLYKCQNGSAYNKNNVTCKSQKEIDDFLSQSKFFNILMERNQFDAVNYENPISILYSFYYQVIDLNIWKKVNYYLKQSYLSDDDGFVFVNHNLLSFISTNQASLTYDFALYNNSSSLYHFVLYSDIEIDYLKRSYSKIQDILAKIGGIAKFFMIVGVIFTHFEMKAKFNKIILRQVYELPNNTKKQRQSILKKITIKKKNKFLQPQHQIEVFSTNPNSFQTEKDKGNFFHNNRKNPTAGQYNSTALIDNFGKYPTTAVQNPSTVVFSPVDDIVKDPKINVAEQEPAPAMSKPSGDIISVFPSLPVYKRTAY